MLESLLGAGKIVNTHGVRGELKILPWADTPDFLAAFERLYIDGAPVKILSARVHKGCVIAALDGVCGISDAMKLLNKTVYIARSDARLEEGRYFVADLIGLSAIDAETGENLGTVQDVLALPSNNVYVISGKSGPDGCRGREILVPAVPEFVKEISLDGGHIKLRLIEGM